MHKSKLIRLLKVLSPDEFKNFPKFIKSPFFNSNKNFLPLYSILQKYYPDFDSPKITKEAAFKKLFSGKKYNYNIMANLMSEFANLIEEYLLNLQFQKEKFEQKKFLNKALGERKDTYDLFKKGNKNLVKELESQTIKDNNYHERLRALTHEFYYHPITDRQSIGIEGIQKSMDNLDLSFAQTKLLYCMEMKARAYLLGDEYSVKLSAELINKGDEYFEKESPVCLIYLRILKLYEYVFDGRVFEEAKILFSKHIDSIGTVEKGIILVHLLNYCIRLMNKGKSRFIKESLELYKIGLSFHAFIEQNRMAEVTFSNVVSAGAKCKEFNWTKSFILKYKHLLEEEEREETFLLSMAILCFTQRQYSETIDLLIQQPFEKPLHIIKSKTLLIRSYFEQFLNDDSYYEMLLAQTYSFEKFIRRNKEISKEKLEAYLNFIQFTRRIGNCILDKKIPDSLIKSLKANPSVSFKVWLLEKMGEKAERVFN